MDYRDAYVPGKDSDDRGVYPYLGWACDHFHGTKKSPISNRDYPLTWEKGASQAKYENLQSLDPIYVSKRLAAPHVWHAAEVFLYVWHAGNANGSAAAAARRTRLHHRISVQTRSAIVAHLFLWVAAGDR
jgi:hypothetical protein